MRLIDADKLVEICRKGWKLFGREDEKLKHWVDENDIREQPTVEAVPIEWIREWYTKHSPLIGGYVAYMLLDWQAENEHNKENTSSTD